jgi:transposase
VSAHEKTSCLIRERSRILLLVMTREQRASEIADKFRIVSSGQYQWTVPSQSSQQKYTVRIVNDRADCNCPDFELRRSVCKHVLAVQLVIQRQQNPDGTETVTETITVSKRKTYPQKWTEYNKAQTQEKYYFQALLHGLCSEIETPEQQGKGQRRIPLADALFAATYKVYSTVSGRRFMTDLRESKAHGFIGSTPHYNSIFNYLENPELKPILTRLIEVSAMPLQSIETEFAADSSGFSTSRFDRWFHHKYGRESWQRQWVKVHIMCGVKTNIVTAVEIADKHAADAKMLPALLETTSQGFRMSEVSADKGYLSAKNVVAIRDAGALPFIAFKRNSTDMSTTGKGSKMWRDMFHYFLWKHDEFLQCYHKRSNVETTFSMIKRKFGDALRSKTDVAIVNEALCKILCHNLVVLIHEMFELGIDPVFLPNGLNPAQQEVLN